jgi:hypothetical protein
MTFAAAPPSAVAQMAASTTSLLTALEMAPACRFSMKGV